MTPYEARKLQASVREVRKLIKEYGDSLRTECDALRAEVERLRAHTWKQERAAVVGWLRDSADPRDSAVSLSYDIAGGDHWPEGVEG
jgi:hypothetical protein